MKYLDLFLNHLKLIHYTKKTIYHCRYYLRKAELYFNEKNLNDERMIAEHHLIEYALYLKNRNKEYFYSRSILYLKKYFSFLEKERFIFLSPMTDFELPYEPRRNIKPIPKDELSIILSNINTDNAFGVRSKAILETLYSTGIRPFELTNVKIIHIDFNKKEIFIEKGKCLKDRVVPVGDTALFWISRYLKEVREKYIKDKTNTYLFIAINGTATKLEVRSLQQIIKVTLKINKLKRFKPYSLRASCASHCLSNGMNIFYIQKLLGHNSIATTMGYLQVDALELKEIFNKKHPRNKYKI